MAHHTAGSKLSSRWLFSAIERATQAGIAAVDADGVQVYANPAFCRMLGFSASELLGRTAPFPYWPPEELDNIHAAFTRTMSDEAPAEGFELRFARKDGARIDVQLLIGPIHDDAGQLAGWLASVHDVTARKRAEAQLTEAQRLAQIGSWEWEIASNAVRWSPELYRQFGRDPARFTPNFTDYMAQIVEEDRPLLQEALRRTLEEDAPYALEIRIRPLDSDVRVQRVLGRVERDESGRPLRLFGTAQDVTDEKRLEQERLDETIHRIGVSFSQELDEQRLVQRITDEATRLADAAFGALFFGDQLYTWAGASPAAFSTLDPNWASALVGEGSAAARYANLPTDDRCPPALRALGDSVPLVSCLAVPVLSRTGDTLGSLVLGHGEPGYFTDRHERLLSALAAHAAVALDNARLLAKLRRSEENAHSARVEAERSAAFLADQREVMELIASGAPLRQTLERIVGVIERYAGTPLHGSILLLDREEGVLRHGAAPSLPEAYCRAIDGVAIGPRVGSCGTSAYTGRDVTVVDIATDPLWADFKDLALAHGLRACWSTPIKSSDGLVLGTFAIYHEEPRAPSQADSQLVTSLGRTASIAIERKRVEEALREANSRKDEFLALLGHELRNPLAPILTALQLMTLRGNGHEKELAAIDRHVRHMVQLVDDLLDISRITRGKTELNRRPVRLSAVLGDAAEMASPLFEERAHHLVMPRVSPELVLHGDKVRLAQIFANLLTNAAKYSERGSRVEIIVRPDGDRVAVTVADNGMGIDPQLLPQIFEPFIQGKRSIDRQQGGLGLGLPLVRSLVGLHDGQVEAFSDGVGLGTRMTVTLPLSAEPVQEAAHQRERTPPPLHGGKRVLVVDDNQDAAELLAELLTVVGHEVSVAHDGPAALALVADKTFDVAVVDIGLPIMDGYELGRRILDRQAIRLIAVTGYGQASDRQRSAEAGFALHLVKPVDADALMKAVAPGS